MNWTWNLRTRDGAMNGLEFARCTTAGGFTRVLVHAAPALASVEVIDDDARVVARGDLDRQGDYSPMTLLKPRRGPHPTQRGGPMTNFMACRSCSLGGGRHPPGVAARRRPQLVAVVGGVLQPRRPPCGLVTARPRDQALISRPPGSHVKAYRCPSGRPDEGDEAWRR